MKKLFTLFGIALCVLYLGNSKAYAQLTGTKTIPGDYSTLKAAIMDLNSNGVGSGGVTFNVTAGYTETLSSDSLYITATGTSSNPIVFQKSGSGSNPCVTRTDAGTKSTSTTGGNGDAIVIIEGSDYLTFDGIDVSSSNQGIEYGYYIRKAGATDGCKYVTVKNCTITMTKGTSAYVVGLYVSNNVIKSLLNSTNGIAVTSEDGRHEYITVTGNTIQNVACGMYFIGYNHTASPYNYYDQNFVIGASGEGNTIKNYGGGNTSTANGINIMYNNNSSISYNTINNTDGGNAGFTGYANGILLNTGKAVTHTVSYNTINLTTLSGAKYLYLIQNNSGDASSYITINNNTFSGTNNSTGAFSAIVQGTASYLYFYSNTIKDMSSASSISPIYNSGGTSSNYIYNNSISNISTTGATSYIYPIYITKGSNYIYNNLIYNINAPATSNADAIRGICITTSTASTTNYIYYNSIYLNSASSGTNFGTSCIYHTYNATATTSSLDMRNNILVNTSIPNGTGLTVALKRSASTDLNNFATTSDNNCLYAGTASSTNLIYYDGTNSIQTISDYKTLVSPRETSSLGENPYFHSPSNLYVIPVSPVIGAGVPITTPIEINTDFNGNERNNAGATTIGAFELASNSVINSGYVTNPVASAENQVISIYGQGGLTFNPTSALTGNVYGNFFYGNTGNPPAGITNISFYYWTVSTDIAVFNSSLRFYFNNIPSSGISNYSKIKLLRRNGPGDEWTEYSDINTYPTYIQANNVTGFSEWAFGGGSDNSLPVLISVFNYTIKENTVTLNWKTTKEINNAGFDIERKTCGTEDWKKLAFIKGKGNTNSMESYTYEDRMLEKGNYNYRLKQIDNNGNYKYYNLNGVVSVGVPNEFKLSQNYPNPFNPITKINYDIPKQGFVSLKVYDVLGREIKSLVSEIQPAGYYSVDFNASGFSSGIYFYRLESQGFSNVKKMMIIK